MKMIGHDHFICHSYSHFPCFLTNFEISIRKDMKFWKEPDAFF